MFPRSEIHGDTRRWSRVRELTRRSQFVMSEYDGFRSGLTLLGVLAIGVLLFNIWIAFSDFGLFLAHDEAEHLHVVFALERGEIPYRDFIENHPLLVHLGLLWLKNRMGLREVIEIYTWARWIIALHFAGSVLLLTWCIALFVDRERSFIRAGCGVAIALSLSGIWDQSSEWHWGLGILWQLRPDWICMFYALLSVVLHARWLQQKRGKGSLTLLVAGGAGGLATAILAKSIYLFLPYALTLMALGIELARRDARNAWALIRSLAGANLLYLVVGVATFAGLLAFELNASGASLQEYWRANFVLNATKHIPLVSDDFNAANVIRRMLGVNLTGALVIAAFAFFRLVGQARSDSLKSYGVIVFCVVTVVVNAMLPAFSNGVTWPHYFIPTLLAAVILFADFLRCLERWVEKAPVAIAPAISRRAALLVFGGMLISLVGCFYAAWEMADGARHREKIRQASNGGVSPASLLPDRLLPADLNYLVFEPQSKPVKARAWGYYFMLSPDRHFWIDNHRLGLGPDPAGHWRAQFSETAPDVVMLQDYDDFLRRRFVLSRQQSVQIDWLWSVIEKNYVCMVRGPIKVQVSYLLTARFDMAGWRRCSPERQLANHRG
jgi:hypothetical protein